MESVAREFNGPAPEAALAFNSSPADTAHADLRWLCHRAAVLARLIARPGGLVRPVLELIRRTESDDVPAVITHRDQAMEHAAAR
ncbi:hypothetical protein [Streptomyces sp. NPDC001348]